MASSSANEGTSQDSPVSKGVKPLKDQIAASNEIVNLLPTDEAVNLPSHLLKVILDKLRYENQVLRDRIGLQQKQSCRVDLELLNRPERCRDEQWLRACSDEAEHYRKIWHYAPTREERLRTRSEEEDDKEWKRRWIGRRDFKRFGGFHILFNLETSKFFVRNKSDWPLHSRRSHDQISSQLLYYRLATVFGMAPENSGMWFYETVWATELLHHKDVKSGILNIKDRKGFIDLYFLGTEEAKKDALELLSFLVSERCRHPYGIEAGLATV